MERRPVEWLQKEKDSVQAGLDSAARRCAWNFDAGGDVVDHANRTVDLATTQALYRLRVATLHQLERARERLLAGLYGTCESCGKPIDPDRLEAAPCATTCMGCQRRREGHGR